jgi:hypothetical protein
MLSFLIALMLNINRLRFQINCKYEIGLPDLGDVDSVPRIALTPNLRNGVWLTGLTVPDDVTGVVCMFSGKAWENVVGQVNGGIPCLASFGEKS